MAKYHRKLESVNASPIVDPYGNVTSYRVMYEDGSDEIIPRELFEKNFERSSDPDKVEGISITPRMLLG